MRCPARPQRLLRGIFTLFLLSWLSISGCQGESDRESAPDAEAGLRPDQGAQIPTDRAAGDRSSEGGAFFSEAAVKTAELTFNKHIAPVIHENCSPCHRAGESAPFELLTYDHVRKRADQIVVVTQDRFMPPWLPEPSRHQFRGERRLTDWQIDAIRRWVEAGAVQGDPGERPPTPVFIEGWQLGEPDIVVSMPRAYTLPDSGTDVFRNFVIPIPIDTTKFVRAVELRPGNPQAVHHANMLIDRTPSSRQIDARDSEIGFEGMEAFGEAEIPEGHFLNWKPGTPPFGGIPGKAWRLDKGTDLIVNLHMLPSGKPERIQAKAGFFLAEEPPQGLPLEMLQLENDRFLDISPGDASFEITDQFTLPVDVDVYGVYPHAHYLGTSVEGLATYPDGTKEYLIHIKRWDFNWQAVYRYETPVSLPAGTKLSLRWMYDNSAGNPFNPSTPARRVKAGNGTYDEMGHLWVQMLAKSRSDLAKLKEAIWHHKVGKYPNNASFVYNLGVVLENQGRLDEAATQFKRAIEIDPEYAKAEHGLGMLLYRERKFDQARIRIEKALQTQPSFAEARVNLALAQMKLRKYDQAMRNLDRVLQDNENYLRAHTVKGMIEADRGNLDRSLTHFQKALAIHPKSPEALLGMGILEQRRNNGPAAIAMYRLALEVKPDYAEAMVNLGSMLANQKRLGEGLKLYQQALQIEPNNSEALNNIGLAYAHQGQLDKAMTYFHRALQAEPTHVGALMNCSVVFSQQGKLSESASICRKVIDIDPEHAAAYNQLGSVYAQQNKLREAEAQFLKAARLQPNDPLIKKRLNTVRAMLRRGSS